MIWRSTHRRWKRAADAAISAVWHVNERDRLAAEVARRIWVTHGGQSCAEARNEGTLLLLEALVSKQLNDDVVRASLGLRYLEALASNACRADYEDACALMEESQWVEAYLRRQVRCPLVAHIGRGAPEDMPEQAEGRRERLYQSLVRMANAELRTAGVAA